MIQTVKRYVRYYLTELITRFFITQPWPATFNSFIVFGSPVAWICAYNAVFSVFNRSFDRIDVRNVFTFILLYKSSSMKYKRNAILPSTISGSGWWTARRQVSRLPWQPRSTTRPWTCRIWRGLWCLPSVRPWRRASWGCSVWRMIGQIKPWRNNNISLRWPGVKT